VTFGRRKKLQSNDPLASYRRVRRADPEAGPESVLAHEERAAGLFGGKRHRGSGSSPFLKSDASSSRYQIECKQTENASLSLKLEWLKKITNEAIGCGKIPALHIHFLRDIGSVERDWVILPASEVERILRDGHEHDQ